MLECIGGTLDGSDFDRGDCPGTVDADSMHLPQVMQAVMEAAAMQPPGAVMVTWHETGSRLFPRAIDVTRGYTPGGSP